MWFADCFVDFAGFGGRAYFQFGDIFNNGFDANGWFFSRICSHYVALMRFLQVSRVFAWYGRRLKILVMVGKVFDLRRISTELLLDDTSSFWHLITR